MKLLVAFVFGMILAVFGFPFTTYQYWVLVSLFAIYGVID